LTVLAGATGVGLVVMPVGFVAAAIGDRMHSEKLAFSIGLLVVCAAYVGFAALVLKNYPSRHPLVSGSPAVVPVCSGIAVVLTLAALTVVIPRSDVSVHRVGIVLIPVVPLAAICGAMLGTFLGSKATE
jgi:hypothetical protein